MLRSNPSARSDARAWAAMLASLLILCAPCLGRQCDKPKRSFRDDVANWSKPGCQMARSTGASMRPDLKLSRLPDRLVGLQAPSMTVHLLSSIHPLKTRMVLTSEF